jgi:hypothetical protein
MSVWENPIQRDQFPKELWVLWISSEAPLCHPWCCWNKLQTECQIASVVTAITGGISQPICEVVLSISQMWKLSSDLLLGEPRVWTGKGVRGTEASRNSQPFGEDWSRTYIRKGKEGNVECRARRECRQEKLGSVDWEKLVGTTGKGCWDAWPERPVKERCCWKRPDLESSRRPAKASKLCSVI